MSGPPYPGLEVDEDLDFQRRSWVVQRVLWVAGAAILGAALLGMFGQGVLSSAETSASADDLAVSYDRFARLLTPTRVEVTIAVEGEQARVWVDRHYLDRMGLQDVQPQPESVQASAERWVFSFEAAPEARQLIIILRLEPLSAGRATGAIGIEGGASVEYTQLVYP